MYVKGSHGRVFINTLERYPCPNRGSLEGNNNHSAAEAFSTHDQLSLNYTEILWQLIKNLDKQI